MADTTFYCKVHNSCLYMFHVHLDFSSMIWPAIEPDFSNQILMLSSLVFTQIKIMRYILTSLGESTDHKNCPAMPCCHHHLQCASSYLHITMDCYSRLSLQIGEVHSLSFIHLILKLSLELSNSFLSSSFVGNKVSWKL